MWRAIIKLLKQNASQLIVSTHSAECLRALGDAIGGKRHVDAKMWQTVKRDREFTIHTVSGKSLALALKYGDEVR
jgi:predicted ATP-dependent endonuclease of OLD family